MNEMLNRIKYCESKCYRPKGFTLVEIILAIAIFTYIFGALMSVYIFMTKNIARNSTINAVNTGDGSVFVGVPTGISGQCSSFAKISIQNLLTQSDFFEIVYSGTSSASILSVLNGISTTDFLGDQINFKYFNQPKYNIIRAGLVLMGSSGSIYEIGSDDLETFNSYTKNRSIYQLDSCGLQQILFSRNTTDARCVNLRYYSSEVATSSNYASYTKICPY